MHELYRSLKIYTDGGSRGNPGPSAGAFAVINKGKLVHKGSKYLGIKTNNEAEYFGVILALRWLERNRDILLNKLNIFFYLDSELVTRQISGVYKTKSNNLKKLIIDVRNLMNSLKISIYFYSIPREKNRIADALVNKEIDENV